MRIGCDEGASLARIYNVDPLCALECDQRDLAY